MNTTKKAFGIGCYVDGAKGIYATDDIVGFARDCGANIEHDEDCDHEDTCDESEFAGCEFAADYEDEATDFMNEHHSLPFAYWGRFEGGDWGLAPDLDGVQEAIHSGELIQIADPGEIDEKKGTKCDGFVFVNDHGNMTLFDCDGNTIWDCV